MNIHLVEPLNLSGSYSPKLASIGGNLLTVRYPAACCGEVHFVKLKDNVWESGWWKLDEDKAKKLVGGEIYFHKKRQEPSFYGGTILGYRVNPDGEYQGKIIFKLQHSPSCRNVCTDKSGWNKDVKIVKFKH